ncbi:MAG: hypothetical protein JXX28_12670 [Deltaproteobacteria bacterium]|nr:hypothetical protein [Deltaproteobacteria bacterium]
MSAVGPQVQPAASAASSPGAITPPASPAAGPGSPAGLGPEDAATAVEVSPASPPDAVPAEAPAVAAPAAGPAEGSPGEAGATAVPGEEPPAAASPLGGSPGATVPAEAPAVSAPAAGPAEGSPGEAGATAVPGAEPLADASPPGGSHGATVSAEAPAVAAPAAGPAEGSPGEAGASALAGEEPPAAASPLGGSHGAIVSAEAPPPRLFSRQVAAYAVLAGLAVLLPVPFVDDLIVGSLRRRMTAQILAEHGVELPPGAVKGLLARPSGCIAGLVLTAVLYPVKKIFRKVFYFLTVKSAIDTASTLVHEGTYLALAAELGFLPRRGADEAVVRRVNLALRFALARTDTSPVTQLLSKAFSSGRSTLRRGTRVLWRAWRQRTERAPDEEALRRGEAEGLVDALDAFLWEDEAYLLMLRERISLTFDRAGHDVFSARQPSRAPGEGSTLTTRDDSSRDLTE